MSQSDKIVEQIKKATRRKFTAEDKIRIILEGLRGEISIFQLCRRVSGVNYYFPLATIIITVFLSIFSSSTVT